MTDTTTPQPDANGWYAIDSAPKELFDGRRVEVWSYDESCIGKWVWTLFDADCGVGLHGATHIRPLGPPPVGVE
jgi:hypothetical protein